MKRGTRLGVGERRSVAVGIGVLAWLVALIWIFPVGWTLLTSFKTEQDAAAQTLHQGLSLRPLQRHRPFDAGHPVAAGGVHELARRRARLDGHRAAARAARGIRARDPAGPQVARRPLLLHLDEVPAGRRVDLPHLRVRGEVEPDRHADDAHRPVHRDQPAARRLDDALVLHGGAARVDRGRRDRRHEHLQSAALGRSFRSPRPASRRPRSCASSSRGTNTSTRCSSTSRADRRCRSG